MTNIIPHDVFLHHILPRLPGKSVRRFMCLSKELKEYLLSDTFSKLFNRYKNHDGFLVLFNDYKEARTFGIIDCQAPENIITPCSFKPPKGTGIVLLTSYHGLVCIRVVLRDVEYYRLTSDDNKYSELILWNPTTNEHKMLSKPEAYKEIHWESTLVLFYSSGEEDYKLVSVTSQSIVHIYSLKSDSWRRIAFEGTSNLRIYGLPQGTCLNENLYFLQRNSSKDNKQYSVIRFDTKTERFTQAKIPLLIDAQNYSSATIMIKKGCIHVCISYESCIWTIIFAIEFWKIDEEGKCKKMGTYQVDPGYMRSMNPLYLKRNGNLLMLGRKYENHTRFTWNRRCQGNCQVYLYSIDLKKNQSKVKGKDNETRCHGVEISEIVRYTETFVSPNKYIK